MKTTTRTKPQACPRCKASNDALTTTRAGATPKPGDVTVCIYCAQILLIGDELQTRVPTTAEWIEIQRNPVWPLVEQMARAVKKLRGL